MDRSKMDTVHFSKNDIKSCILLNEGLDIYLDNNKRTKQ